jgi:hypothetical protein
MATGRSVAKIKSALLRPSLTSKFFVTITPPSVLRGFYNQTDVDEFYMSCSEASLPGVSLNTQEITGDRHGVTERNAYRRMYDDRIDLTFYVEGKTYSQIRYFERWINFIVGNDTKDDRFKTEYDYKVKYPREYKTGMTVSKFEKDDGFKLNYNFIAAYPIAINSMPLSYGSTDLLKCTVSMTYLRYIIGDTRVKESSVIPPKTNEYDSFGNTNGPGTPFVERDTATGGRMDGGSDGPLLTARQALGLDPI